MVRCTSLEESKAVCEVMLARNVRRLTCLEINDILSAFHDSQNPATQYIPFTQEFEDTTFTLLLHSFSKGTVHLLCEKAEFIPDDYYNSDVAPTQVVPGMYRAAPVEIAHQPANNQTDYYSRPNTGSSTSSNNSVLKFILTGFLVLSGFSALSFALFKNNTATVTEPTPQQLGSSANPQGTQTQQPKTEKLVEVVDPAPKAPIVAPKPDPEVQAPYVEPEEPVKRKAKSQPIPVQSYEGKTPEEAERINKQIFKKPKPKPQIQPSKEPVITEPKSPEPAPPTLEPKPVEQNPIPKASPTEPPSLVVPTEEVPANPEAQKLKEKPGNVVDLGNNKKN
jgi:hypothetical protein